MTADELLEAFALTPPCEELPRFRQLLHEETEKESSEQGDGDTELMKLLCVYLFANRLCEDSLLIWRAKRASMDTDASFDIQLLCGAGLEETKSFLISQKDASADAARRRLKECENSGIFENFSVDGQLQYYRQYYGTPMNLEIVPYLGAAPFLFGATEVEIETYLGKPLHRLQREIPPEPSNSSIKEQPLPSMTKDTCFKWGSIEISTEPCFSRGLIYSEIQTPLRSFLSLMTMLTLGLASSCS